MVFGLGRSILSVGALGLSAYWQMRCGFIAHAQQEQQHRTSVADNSDRNDTTGEDEDDFDGVLPQGKYWNPNPDCPIKEDIGKHEVPEFEDDKDLNLNQCPLCIAFAAHTPCGHLFEVFKQCVKSGKTSAAEAVTDKNFDEAIKKQTEEDKMRCHEFFIDFMHCVAYFPNYYSRRQDWLDKKLDEHFERMQANRKRTNANDDADADFDEAADDDDKE